MKKEQEQNDFQFWNEYFRERRTARREADTVEIEKMKAAGMDVRQITEYQFRFWDFLDVYPTNRRWHNIKTGKRGGYGDICNLIEKHTPK